MPYVTVDVDMSEFDTFEITDELIKRLKRKGRNKPTDKQMKEIGEAIVEFMAEIGHPESLPIATLDDKMKLETLQRVWQNMSAAELDKRLA